MKFHKSKNIFRVFVITFAIIVMGGMISYAKDKNGDEQKIIQGQIDANLVQLISKYLILYEGIAYELWFPRTAKMGQPTTKTHGVTTIPIPGYKDGYPIDLSAAYKITGRVISDETDFTKRKSNEAVQACFQREMISGLED